MAPTITASVLSDDQLVTLARSGDQDAFGELLCRHRQKCVDLAIYFLRNRGDAEDEVQNSFSKAYAHLDQYHGEGEFSTWLARIISNQCLMLLRVRRRTRFVYLDEKPNAHDAPPMELPSCGPDPEGEFAFRQMKSVLRTEI